MMRPIFLLLALLLYTQLLLSTGCRSSAPAEVPTMLAEPVETSGQVVVQSTATSVIPTIIPTARPATPTVEMPATTVESTTTLDLAPFTLTLPIPWSALRPRLDEWRSQVQGLTTLKPELVQATEALLSLSALTTTIVLAWPPADLPAITLVAAVTPAEDVSLQTYIATAAAELQQQSTLTGAQVTIQRADIRYDLQPDQQLPLAILHYTLSTSASATAPFITGYQVMTIDKTAEHMILLTFTVREAEPELALAAIESIVATLQEN